MHRALIVVLCLAAIALTYSYILTADQSRLSGRYDVYRYYGPINFFMDHSIHHGEFPLWNPLIYCGMPHAANPQSFTFYPPNLVRSILTFAPTAYKTQLGFIIMMALHIVLVSVSLYALARAHGLSVGASCAAACAFGFSSLMVRRVCEYHYITTIAWLPLQMLLLKRALDANVFALKARFATLTGLVFGICILSGWLQIASYVGVTLFGYGALYRLLRVGSDGKPAKRWTWKLWAGDMAAVMMVIVLGGLIACAVLVPAAELATFTARQGNAKVGLYNDLREWPLSRFYESFIVYPGLQYEAETLRGSGVVALLLALAGFTYRRKKLVALFAILYIMLFDCSMGPPFPVATVVNWLTPFTPSAYSRAYDFALLPLSMLVGLGVDALAKSMSTRAANVLRTAGLFIGGVTVIYALTTYLSPGHFLRVSPWVMFAPAAALPIMLCGSQLRLPGLVKFALPLLILIETVSWNQSYVPWLVNRRIREPERPPRIQLTLPQDNTRGTDHITNRALYWLQYVMNGYDPLAIKAARDVISGPPRDRHYFRSVKDWEATAENHRGNLFLKRPFWLARQYVVGNLPAKTAMFPSATTVFLDTKLESPISEIKAAALSRRSVSKDARTVFLPGMDGLKKPVVNRTLQKFSMNIELPRAVHSALVLDYTSSCSAKIETMITDKETGRTEQGKRYDIRPTGKKSGIVELPLPDFSSMDIEVSVNPSSRGTFQFTDGYVLSDENDENGLIRIIERKVNSVEIEVGDLPAHRILTFIDAAYPGWHAYLDAEPVPIYKANGAFKAIVVPPGRHTVRFEFRPRTIYAGVTLSLVGLCAVAAAYIFLAPSRCKSAQ